MSKVSVVIPVYNVEKYLGRCLDSIISQTHQDFEILAVYDGGTDNSLFVLKEYASKDNRIKILVHNENKGPLCARETGYKAATGEYIMFVDSDDTIPQNSINELLNAAICTGYDIIAGNFSSFPYKKEKGFLTETIYANPIGAYRALITNKLPHSLCGKLFNSRLFKEYHYRIIDNMTNGEDAFLLYQIIEHSNGIKVIESTVYNYYLNPSSSTHTPFSETKLSNVITTQKLRIEISQRYPEIKFLFENHVTRALCTVYYFELRAALINRYLTENNLISFMSMKRILKAHEYKGFIRHYFLFFKSSIKRLNQKISH